MKNTLRALTIVASLVLLVAGLTGCSTQSGGAVTDENMKVILYFSNGDASELIMEERMVPKTDKAPELVVLEELIKGPQSAGSKGTLPEGTEIIKVEVLDGVAYVDLSQSTVDNHSGGSAGDQMSIGSMVYTLTELAGVEEVQFLLEGEIVEALFGHVATDQPISR